MNSEAIPIYSLHQAGIPDTIASLAQWVPCYPSYHPDPKTGLPINTPKRPMGGPTSPYATTLSRVYNKLHAGQLCGFCFTSSDPFICIDLDDATQLTPRLKALLKLQGTYIEYSISGKGLHIIYRTDKTSLQHRKAQDKYTSDYKGSVFIKDQFVVITGNRHPLSSDDIALIDPFVFESHALRPRDARVTPIPLKTASLSELQNEANFVFTDIQKWLAKIPTRVNDKVRGIYAMLPNCPTSPDDYEHWRVIAAATHYAAALLGRVEEGARVFDEWSQGDPAKYQGFEDCRQKYLDNPPKFDGTDISHKTLQKLYNLYTISWPVPVIKDGKSTNKPELNHLDNFLALLDH